MNSPFDAEILAYIELNEAWPAGEGVAGIRASYEGLRAHLRGDWPDGVTTVDLTLGGQAARRYEGGARGTVLFFHGGGFVVGSLDSHDDLCAGIAGRLECTVIAVEYRLAPDHPFPAAYDDALAAARAMQGPFVLVGDSAGGTLAAGVAVAMRGEARVLGQVLAYPALGGEALGLASYIEKAKARLLTADDMQWYRAQYAAPPGDTRAAPLLAVDLTGVTPCIAFAAAEDPLCDDAAAWVARLNEAGVVASAHTEDGLPHSYLFARHHSKRATGAFERFADAIGGFLPA